MGSFVLGTQAVSSESPSDEGLPKQFLTFYSGQKLLGLAIREIDEILEVETITPVPRVPRFIRGIMNVRGAVIPVIDLAAHWSDLLSPLSKRSCILLIELSVEGVAQRLGLLVDEVREIIEVQPADLLPAPEFGAVADMRFVDAMVQLNEGFVILLAVEHILTAEALPLTVLQDVPSEP